LDKCLASHGQSLEQTAGFTHEFVKLLVAVCSALHHTLENSEIGLIQIVSNYPGQRNAKAGKIHAIAKGEK
jgi:hypothetical protein